ncbi:uncharacterized protein Tco025E_04326 [Trypanosoma conorhini]|uniref:PH-like domain-containing protein n=1 Tax=Trypanosoma conorhini TaxID=83891 RepID=A0A3R7P7U0_9TRYP|nr:uncharacterized protein Tco025E_04326 [Trypanosoma conorhini]RNF18890.1 hypothetical protein Tco025E_04326 [Trypanosoma conorhini]
MALAPSQRSPCSTALGDTSHVAVEACPDFSVFLRSSRNGIKAAKRARENVGVSALNKDPQKSYKRYLPESKSISSENLQRKRNESLPNLGDANASAAWSPTLKGPAFFHLADDVFLDPTDVQENTLRRQCFQPAWSLIGTFKTNIYSLVDVDPRHDVLKWHQQTPRNEFQQMRIPLSSIKEVRISSVAREEMGPNWVIVRTSTKPTQIVFGFEKLSNAKRMRAALQPFPYT